MTCKCFDRVNEQLAPHNAKVKEYFVLDGSGKMPWPIETAQIETGRGKKKAPTLFATYCPFCGTEKGEDPLPYKVSEKQPKEPETVADNTKVLAYWPECDEFPAGWYTSYYLSGNVWQHSGGYNDYHIGVKPTHWRPLPEAPNA